MAIDLPCLPHTSFKAVDGGRDLNPSSQQIGELRESQGEEDTEDSCGREEQRLWVVMVDVCEGVHCLARRDGFIVRTSSNVEEGGKCFRSALTA